MIEEDKPGPGELASWRKPVTIDLINQYKKLYNDFHSGAYKKKQVWEMIQKSLKKLIKPGNPVPPQPQIS